MTATEGRIKPQSISDDVLRVVAELRQALRPIESPYGESSGGPDGWGPEPDEIAEWEMTFREHATPANVSALLAALTLVQAERDERERLWTETYRLQLVESNKVAAERDAMQQERDELRAALESIALAGMSGCGQESEEGMRDWHARRAWDFIAIASRALTPKATQPTSEASRGR